MRQLTIIVLTLAVLVSCRGEQPCRDQAFVLGPGQVADCGDRDMRVEDYGGGNWIVTCRCDRGLVFKVWSMESDNTTNTSQDTDVWTSLDSGTETSLTTCNALTSDCKVPLGN